MSQVVRQLDYLTTHTSLSPIRRGFAPGFVNYKKGTRLAAASDKAQPLLAHGRWISPGTPASSTTKTGRHDIAELLLKVALNTINQINQIKSYAPSTKCTTELCGSALASALLASINRIQVLSCSSPMVDLIMFTLFAAKKK